MSPAVADEFSFSHLLGLSLPAGRRHRDVLELRFRADSESVLTAAESSLQLLGSPTATRHATGSGVRLVSRSARWPDLLPHLGPAAPADPFRLAPWQHELCEREPAAFLGGLLMVGGRRRVNRFVTTRPSGREARYAYPRYAFSSASPQLRALFCDACERVGVDWTQSRATTVSVTHRRSVAVLDAICEPPVGA